MSDSYPLRQNENNSLDLDEVRSAMHRSGKIQLIKLYRNVSGLGLKESKDVVERHFHGNHDTGYTINEEELLDEYKRFLCMEPDPYTKEEFMNLIENAIDNMGVFHYTDMIEATTSLLENVKKHGGLKTLAKERDEFLREV